MNLSVRSRVWLLAAAATALVIATATLADRVFERSYSPWFVMLAPLGPLAVGMATASLSRGVRIAAQVGGCLVLSVLATVAVSGSFPGDTARAAVHGVASLLGPRWPVPRLVIPQIAVSLFVIVAAAVAVELAVSRRFSVGILLPPFVLLVVFALVSAKAGPPPPRVLVVFAIGSLAVLRMAALLRVDLPNHARGPARTAERRSAITMAVLGITAVIVGVVPAALADTVANNDRYDPRESADGTGQSLEVVSPLARLDEWRSMRPAGVMFTTTGTEEGRWRLATLTRFDGRTWMPAADYRTVGRQVQSPTNAEDEPLVATVTIGQLSSPWLPLPDSARDGSQSRVLAISAPVRLDGGYGSALASRRAGEGTRYEIQYERVVPDSGKVIGLSAAKATSPFTGGMELSESVVQLATKITAGAASDYERAKRIEEYLRSDYLLDPEAGAGHSIGILELFLNTTHRGRDEQFVASFALLAAAVQLPVRVSVGFDLTAVPGNLGTQALSSAATAWPEIDFVGAGWVAFNPVPPSEAPTATGGGRSVSPAAVDEGRASATTAPPSPSTTISEHSSTASSPARGVISGLGGRVILGTSAFVLLVAAYLISVLRLKQVRRNRRSNASETGDRVAGAFRSGIDTLVDLGARAPMSQTDLELVRSSSVSTIDAVELEPLAVLATRTVFDDAPLEAMSDDEAWEQLREFEQAARQRVSWWRWTRARLSLRSLRRGLPDP